MMIKKASLSPILRMAATLDSTVCGYMGVQVPPGRFPVFYRSSTLSFLQSEEFNPGGTRHFVSFSHLQDCLRASADSLEVLVDPSGIVCIESVDGPYRNFLHVHTVREGSTGVKYHSIGDPKKETLDPTSFSGIDVDSLDIQQQSLGDGVLFLSTQGGVVKWRVPDSLRKTALQPRKSFLKFACGTVLDALTISDHGYWIAHREGVVGCFSSSTMGDSSRQVYGVPGTVIAQVDAVRLVSALRSALILCEKTDRVEIGILRGVSVRDKYGNEAAFSLCEPTATLSLGGIPWKFSITGLTAELIVTSLGQSSEKEIAIQTIVPNSGGPAMRLTRGLFEIDFRVMP